MPEASAWFETTQESYAMEQSLINREEKAQHHLWGDFVPFFLFAVAFRSVLLIIDPQPRFFWAIRNLTCSLRGAIGSNDRSWLYGLFINGLFVFTHSSTDHSSAWPRQHVRHYGDILPYLELNTFHGSLWSCSSIDAALLRSVRLPSALEQ